MKATNNIKSVSNMKKVMVAAVGLIIGGSAYAQQTPISNFYNFNEYLLNPAEAGFKDKLYGTASHRLQWQGIEGAPTTTFFGVHGMLNEKMGLGIKINVDQTDILKQFNAAASYAYRIRINEKARLNFGVSAQVVQNSVSFGDAVIGNLADEVINGGDESGVNFDAEAGVMLEYGKLKLGLASANLFESGVDYNIPDNGQTGTFERIRQFNAYGSYVFDLNKDWTLEPFAIVRNQGVESFQLDINALAAWKETLYLGAGYRQEAGFIGRVGFQVTDQLIAAYAYEFSNTGVASFSSGSHEFMLGYRIKSKKKAPAKVMAREPIKKEEPKVMEEKVVEEKPKMEEKVVEKAPEPIKEVVKETPPPAPPVPPAPKKVEKAKEVTEMFREKIVFSFEGNKIPESIKADLDKIAKVLVSNSKERVRVEGHTSTDGTKAQNQIVSERRAKLVKDYLISKGVKAEQIQTKAMLDTELLVPDNTLENKKINRRAEIELIN